MIKSNQTEDMIIDFNFNDKPFLDTLLNIS